MGNVEKPLRNVQVLFQLQNHFSLISKATKIKMRQFKILIPSTWYGQCREVRVSFQLHSRQKCVPTGTYMGSKWFQFPICGLGANWFVRAGNFLSRSYCLHGANRLMYPLTTDIPINHWGTLLPWCTLLLLTYQLTADVPINRWRTH